jgi:hypothetical protein
MHFEKLEREAEAAELENKVRVSNIFDDDQIMSENNGDTTEMELEINDVDKIFQG